MPKAPDPLKLLADDEQPEPRRIEAARALGEKRERAAIDRMLAIADRSEAFLAKAIVEALRAMDAHEVLGERLKGPDPAARADAAKKLSRLMDARALPTLLAAAKDAAPEVRRAAVHGVSFLPGKESFDALVAALSDADPEVRAYAAAGIGRSGDPRAARTLAAAREGEQDDIVRDFIDAAIRKLPAESAK
jgi:HEAT repeat protein